MDYLAQYDQDPDHDYPYTAPDYDPASDDQSYQNTQE